GGGLHAPPRGPGPRARNTVGGPGRRVGVRRARDRAARGAHPSREHPVAPCPRAPRLRARGPGALLAPPRLRRPPDRLRLLVAAPRGAETVLVTQCYKDPYPCALRGSGPK